MKVLFSFYPMDEFVRKSILQNDPLPFIKDVGFSCPSSEMIAWLGKYHKISDEDAKLLIKDEIKENRILFRPKICVIGGGMAGCRMVCELYKIGLFDLTLISLATKFEFIPSFPTLFGNSAYLSNIQRGHDVIFQKKIRIIHQEVLEITPTKLILKDESEFSDFHYLIIATGSRYELSCKITKDKDSNNPIFINCLQSDNIVKEWDNLSKSKEICIIGGGPAGIEVCGEIVSRFPDKKVILVSSYVLYTHFRKSKFLEDMNVAADQIVKNHFKKYQNLTIMYDRVMEIDGTRVILKNTEFRSDCVVICNGLKPNSQMIKNPEMLDSRGAIIVNEYLQTPKYHWIYCCGDITNIKEQKMYALGIRHSFYLPGVIVLHILGEKAHKYESITKGVFLRLGPYKAVLLKNNRAYFESSLLNSLLSWVEPLKMWKLQI